MPLYNFEINVIIQVGDRIEMHRSNVEFIKVILASTKYVSITNFYREYYRRNHL